MELIRERVKGSTETVLENALGKALVNIQGNALN